MCDFTDPFDYRVLVLASRINGRLLSGTNATKKKAEAVILALETEASEHPPVVSERAPGAASAIYLTQLTPLQSTLVCRGHSNFDEKEAVGLQTIPSFGSA